MKILSILTYDASRPPSQPSPEDFAKMQKFVEETRSKGVLLDTGGTTGELGGMFEMKISRNGDKITTIDGPFTESKELVGGYALMDVKDREAAIYWTNRFLELAGNATCHLHEVSAFEE